MHMILLVSCLFAYKSFSAPQDRRLVKVEDQTFMFHKENFSDLRGSSLYRILFLKRGFALENCLNLTGRPGVYIETFPVIHAAIENQNRRLSLSKLQLSCLPQDVFSNVVAYHPSVVEDIVSEDLKQLGLHDDFCGYDGWAIGEGQCSNPSRSLKLFGLMFDFVLVDAVVPFAILKEKVSRMQHIAVMGESVTSFEGYAETNISAVEAEDFIQALNVQCNRLGWDGGFCLPSHEQWDQAFQWLSDHQEEGCGLKLYDDDGVAEWTSTRRYETGRVIRGDNWLDDISELEAVRVGGENRRYFDVGFRVIRNISDS